MDTVEMSLCELDLQFYFVTADGRPAPDQSDLICCFERIADRFDSADSYRWISDADCLQLAATATTPLTRKSVFIFSTFSGEVFDRMRLTKAMLLGPKCIIDCFLNDTNIPNVPSPIFNVALRHHTVCTSGLKAADKDNVQRLVYYMGGQFDSDLSASTTYLVTNTTMSIKYEKAVSFGIRTVKPDWTQSLWQLSQSDDVVLSEDGDQEDARRLYEEHRIPIFHQLGITSTGISATLRTQLKALVEAHGGIYHGSFKSELIQILMVTRSQTGSDKFKAAIKCRKTCLTPEWFTDSVARGYALPIEEYRVYGPETSAAVSSRAIAGSTPTKALAPNESAFNADSTTLSDIMGNVTVNESRMSLLSRTATAATSDRHQQPANGGRLDHVYKVVLANINVQQAKKSGAFLDGCSVFLCGFNGEEKEKLTKILTNACATRFDEYDSRVEYVIVGQPNGADVQLISGLNIRKCVTLQWLVASIDAKCPADENHHLYTLPANRKPSPDDAADARVAALIASPASKKNMASMSSTFRKPQPRRLQMDDELVQAQAVAQANAESDLLQQYLVAPEPAPTLPPVAAAVDVGVVARSDTSKSSHGETSATASDATGADETVQYLSGLTFFVEGFTAESEETLVEDIEMAGGKMVSARFEGTVDYVIVPMDIFRPEEVKMKGRHMVNEHWVADTAQAQACVDIAYYHRPFEWQDEENTPLADMLLVLTTYSGSERIYLTSIGRIMGADVQERYIKTQKPVLICPRPEGAKYNGAIKWGLPVVSCEWLLTCARRAQKVRMRPYLVGASVAPADESTDESTTSTPTASSTSFGQPPAASTARPDVGGTDSLQITAASDPTDASDAESPMPPPKNAAAATQAETSLERLKRQRPEDFGAQTPLLKHRRLSEIANTTRKDSPFGGSQSPSQAPVDYATQLKSNLANLSTPCRETVFNELMRLKEAETPETKRRLQALSTPDLLRSPLPVEFRTPAREQRLRDNRSQFRGWVPSPEPSTPFAEIQRRFWKNALGDNYSSPSQRLDSQTQAPTQTSPNAQHVEAVVVVDAGVGHSSNLFNSTQEEFAAAAPAATSTQQQPPTTKKPDPTAANTHVKRLSDFIQTKKNGDNTPTKPEVPTDRQPDTQSQLLLAGRAGTSEAIDAVGWRDPADFHDEHRFRSRNTMQHRGTPKFNISCLDAVRLERIEAHIVSLGGEVCTNRGGYDPTCTHVLCEKPSRSEKIFSAIAAGKWLLTLRYVEDSALAEGFLNEEAYEFGNPLAAEMTASAAAGGGAASDETGRAAYRWRRELQTLRQQRRHSDADAVCGVFSAFRVILHTNKKAAFKNLLEAGGGHVLDVTEPYETSKEALTATHCVLDSRNKLSSRDRQALQRVGVACVNISFLQAYVSLDVAPDPKDYTA